MAATAPWVLGLGVGLLAGGGVVLIIGVAMLVIGVVALARGTELDLTGRAAVPGQPIRLEGHLQEPLNRWLWLVKWLLLIPHFIVLAVLWIAFFVVTVDAFFAILFTGRYPRRSSSSTPASCAGPGGSPSTATAPGHRRLPPVQPRPPARLPRHPRDRVPRAAVPAWC